MDRPDDPPHSTPDDRTDDQTDARWMTFAELAAARGIGKLSAAALVRRHGWRRQTDNRGRVMALVPHDGPELRRPVEADHPRDHPPDDPAYTAAFETALAAIEAAHARELATLREQITGAEQTRIAMQALVEQFAGQLHDADEVMKAERARSDALLAGLHRDLDAAKEHVDRAEAAIAEERARADALRDRLEAAQQQAQEAAQAAEELRQAEAARKARGHLRRAWDGWRGR
jgi:hypothetical protein